MAQQVINTETAPSEKPKQEIPITEVSEENSRRIPKAVFVEDVEAWVEKYGDGPIFEEMNTLY